MKRTRSIVMFGLIALVCACISFGACSSVITYKISVDPSKSLVLEVGDEVDYTQYFIVTDNNGNRIVVTEDMLDLSAADTSKAGSFEVTISVGNSTATASFTVVEKTPDPTPDPDPDPDDHDLGEKLTPSNNAMNKGDELDAAADTMTYWFVEDAGWNCGTVVTMNTATYTDGTVHFNYTGGSVDYSVQLFYKNSQLQAGKKYFVFVTIKVDKDLQIKLNGTIMNLTAGTHTLAVMFDGADTDLIIQLSGVGNDTEDIIISDIYWREVVTPEVIPDPDPNPNPNPDPDPNPDLDPTPVPDTPANPDDYTLGEKLDPTTAWEKNDEPNAKANTMTYWFAEDAGWNCGTVVTMNDATYTDGTVHFNYTGGSVDFSVQLFYKNSQLQAGKKYFVFVTIKVDKDLQIKLNGTIMNLTAGTHTLAVMFDGADTDLSIQLYGVGSNTVDVTISDISWQEVLSKK